MQNPVTNSGGMLTGTIDETGPESPLGLSPGQRVARIPGQGLTIQVDAATQVGLGLLIVEVAALEI